MNLRNILLCAIVFWATLMILSTCSSEKKSDQQVSIADTIVKVYGPYRAVRLPITKGVKMANPIQLSRGPADLLYGANQTGEVYTLHDSDDDGLEDSTALYCNVADFGLRSPVGFAHKGDTVFIGTAQQVRIFIDTNKDNKADTSWIFYNQIPESAHPYEWTSGLSFGPDGWLYAALATDSWNASPASDPKGYRGAIIRISPDGKTAERVATGIRSVPGMAFNSLGDLFFVDNEGGGNPTEELNRLVINSFYGHNKKKYPSDSGNVTKPEFDLQSEVAPSAMEFNRADNDFGSAAGNLFVAYYGPGERWTRGAIGRVVMEREADGKYQYTEHVVADMPKISDIAFGKDGNLYVAHHGMADYWYNAVYNDQGGFYKLIYDPSLAGLPMKTRPKPVKTFSPISVEAGKQLFAERGCLGCHQVDGATELIGPNLKDVAKNFTREEILEEIQIPSKRIKPSMMGIRVVKKDGKIFSGRLVNSDEKQLSLMVIGNSIVDIARKDIAKTENLEKSLMYEGLLNGLTDEQKESLMNYLASLNN